MAERVVVTGLGVVSSLGVTVDAFWRNLVAGSTGISPIEAFATGNLERRVGGEIKKYQIFTLTRHLPRSHQFAIDACTSALADAGLTRPARCDIALGSIVAGLEFLEKKHKAFKNYPLHMLTANVIEALQLRGAAFTVSGACAAGNYAVSLAYERIKRGETDLMLAGGADYFSEGTFIGLYKVFSLAPVKCQPFDKNRKGLIPAEGAGTLVLEALSSARKRNAHIYAEVLGYGTSTDAYHPLIPLPEGIYGCMEDALRSCDVGARDIDYISAHGTGTVPNDKAECQAIRKLFGKVRSKKIPTSSIKSMLGHAMGAASAIESIACCLAIARGVLPPTINYETPDPECAIDCVPNTARAHQADIILNNAFGFGGMNCSVILRRWKN